MNLVKATFALSAVSALSACGADTGFFSGLRGLQGSGDYIAVAADIGQGTQGNIRDNAAIAVTPDGCQAWVIDDGVEGRASNRLDPVSGLPVCGGEPGVVYGNYLSGESEIRDRVPGNPLPVRIENIETQTTEGHFPTPHE